MGATMHIKTTVLPYGKIEIDTPNIAAGTVVTVTLEAEAVPPQRHVSDIIAELPGHRMFKTAEEVEAYVKEERASWEERYLTVI